jgi:hypothetical protein
MNPDLPDKILKSIVNHLVAFRNKELTISMSVIDERKHAEKEAKEILTEAYEHLESFATNRSSLTKYDLLKWVSAKKQTLK